MTEASEESGAAAGALQGPRGKQRACEGPGKEEPMRLPHTERGAEGTVWGSAAGSPQGWCCCCALKLCLQCGEAAALGLCGSLWQTGPLLATPRHAGGGCDTTRCISSRGGPCSCQQACKNNTSGPYRHPAALRPSSTVQSWVPAEELCMHSIAAALSHGEVTMSTRLLWFGGSQGSEWNQTITTTLPGEAELGQHMEMVLPDW